MSGIDESAAYYEEVRIEEDVAGHTHIHLDAPKPARTHDAAPLVSSVTEANPTDPRSGQQPEGVFTCDFRRGRDGRWTGQAGGRRFRLQQSHDGSCFRVTEDRDRPWSVRIGDRALADPSHARSANEEAAGLSRWQGLLDLAFRRKDAAA